MQKSITSTKKNLSPNASVGLGNNKSITKINDTVKGNRNEHRKKIVKISDIIVKAIEKSKFGKKIKEQKKLVEKPKVKELSLFDKIDAICATNIDIEYISMLNYAHQTMLAITYSKFQTTGDIVSFEIETSSYAIYFTTDDNKLVVIYHTDTGHESDKAELTKQAEEEYLAMDQFYKATGMFGIPKVS